MPFQEHSRVWERPSAGRSGNWGTPPGTPEWESKPWRPIVTWWLLGIMAAVYALQLIVLSYDKSHGTFWSMDLFLIAPDWPSRPWSLLTSTFSHDFFKPMHLFFNGLFLFFFGPSVERLIGRKRYVALFLVGGALSGLVQVHAVSYLNTGSIWAGQNAALGASGALMLVMGILMVLTPRATIFLMFFPVPLWIGGLIFAALDVLGAINPDPAHRVGNLAHLAGMALGLAYGFWAKQDLKRRGIQIVEGPGPQARGPWGRR